MNSLYFRRALVTALSLILAGSNVSAYDFTEDCGNTSSEKSVPELSPSFLTFGEGGYASEKYENPAIILDEQPAFWWLKTNLATYTVLVANIAVETRLSKNLTLSFPIYYGACDYFSSDTKFRVFGTQPELRWWLASGGEYGFFAGVHLSFGWYNFTTSSSKYRIQDHGLNTPALGCGINAGYRLPILSSLSSRWGLEFSLGVGAIPAKYDRFVNIPNGRKVDTVSKTYWGIDNAAVTLTYRFNSR